MAETTSPVFATPKYRLKFVNEDCKMCQTCASVCSMNKWSECSVELGAMNLDINFSTADVVLELCKQCPAPSCVYVCARHAFFFNETAGVYQVDLERCSGCGLCVDACPTHAISFNRPRKKVAKCDLCGGDPLCVKFCPGEAITLVEIDRFGREKG